MDEWLDDDDNLAKWEDNTLTASDRRILLANWYYKACKKALEGEAKIKYFQPYMLSTYSTYLEEDPDTPRI